MRIVKNYLNYLDYKTNIFYFIPDEDKEIQPVLAIFCHGYTADKSSILSWATRLQETGVPVALFDLPGHYLGNFSEVQDFEHFKLHAHELFMDAFSGLKKEVLEFFPLNDLVLESPDLEVVLGGHSLGALLSIKAMQLSSFQKFRRRAIGVGIGMAPKNVVHMFDTPFYKNALLIREELVSPALNSKNVFPWIKAEKEKIQIANERIHLISGADDLVVGKDGMERFFDRLKELGNSVTMERPTKLPHHEPQLAAGYIKKYLKNEGLIK